MARMGLRKAREPMSQQDSRWTGYKIH